jgi:hypothetical protein
MGFSHENWHFLWDLLEDERVAMPVPGRPNFGTFVALVRRD